MSSSLNPLATEKAAPPTGFATRRWLAALALQLAILAAVPYPKVSAYLVGFPATLRVEVLDPFDPLRGRYVQLSYPDLADEATAKLPGADAGGLYGKARYVILESAEGGYFKPKSVHESLPHIDPSYQVVLKGHFDGRGFSFGSSRYHLADDEAPRLEASLREHPGQGRAHFKVDGSGHAWLEKVVVGGGPSLPAPQVSPGATPPPLPPRAP